MEARREPGHRAADPLKSIMRIGSLFSGYGGLDLAAQQYFGGDLAWYSEIEPAACQILAAHHPIVPNLGDITVVNWATVEPIDVLTGGYPCQPFSHAGKRKGSSDERHLWPFVASAIDALRPRVVVLENVRGHLSLGFGDVLAELSRMGYDARWGVVRASDAGAPHGRARIFIVAYPEGERRGAGDRSATPATGRAVTGVSDSRELPADSSRGPGREGEGWCVSERARAAGLAARDFGTATDTDSLRHERDRLARDGWAGPSYSDESPADTSGRGSAAFRAQRPSETRSAARLDGDREPATDSEGDAGWFSDGDREPATDSSGAERGGAESEHLSAASGPTTESGERAGTPTDWGKYALAITRWERVLGRTAPDPTIVGANGRPRLNPVFVEWMMGLDLGHVTGHGLRAAQELKALGNGVCPQQAFLALRMILGEAS